MIIASAFQSIGAALSDVASTRTEGGSFAPRGLPSQCLPAGEVRRNLSRKLELCDAYHLGRYGRLVAPGGLTTLNPEVSLRAVSETPPRTWLE